MKVWLRLTAVVLAVGSMATSCILSPKISTADLERLFALGGHRYLVALRVKVDAQQVRDIGIVLYNEYSTLFHCTTPLSAS